MIRGRRSVIGGLIGLLMVMGGPGALAGGSGYQGDIKVRLKKAGWVGAGEETCSGGNGPEALRKRGKVAVFEAKVKNLGTGEDYYTLDIGPEDPDFKTTYFYGSENVTEAVHTSGTYDIGSLEPGKSSKLFTVKVKVRDSAPHGDYLILGITLDATYQSFPADCGSANVEVE